MICFYCKGDLIETTTTYMEDLGKCIVIIKNVPCNKCQQCGEISYSGTVVRQIERIIAKLQNTLTEIAVVNYNNDVA